MKNKSDGKFHNRVKHLQGFIGMPYCNYRKPSLEEIRELDRKILEQQKLSFEPERKSLLSRVISRFL